MAGSRVRHEDGSLRLSAFRFPGVLSEVETGLKLGLASRLLSRWRVWAPPPQRTGPVDWVSGASVLMRTQMLEEVGLFDEGFFLYFEETDLSYRALFAGWPTYYVVEAEAEHIGQVSTQFKDHERPRPGYWFDSRRYYLKKNHGPLKLWAANGAFVGASALYQLRRRLQRKPDQDPPELLRDFVRHALSKKNR
jgi:GT2 family glycosyltransferase